jgi:hypothetical protein
MSGNRQPKKPKRSGWRGKSKIPKRISEGRLHKSKKARLRCAQCGRWFENLGQINQHYGAVGHKKKVKPPKKIKFSQDVSQQDMDLALGLIELLRNPIKFREKVRERLEKRMRRRGYYV